MELIGRILSGDRPLGARLLTFTRAATAELTKKVAEHETATTLQPSTVHSFAISVLMQNPGLAEFPEPLRIADDWERCNIVRGSLGRVLGASVRRMDQLLAELAANWEALEPRPDERVTAAQRARFMAVWQEHRQVYGYTLLSELPWALLRALQNHPDLSGTDYDLLVVDEYQDLNACDLAVLALLAERGCSVVAVGDDDQSIYSFRRAAPEGIRRFPSDYRGAIDYPLSITHRCGARIIDWAGNVIARDTGRDPKKPLPTPNDGSPDGEAALLAFAGQRAEPNGLAAIVHNLIHREGLQPSDILILLRSDHNGQFSRPIKEALEARGIPYADPEEIRTQLGDPLNRTRLAVCRLLANRADSLAWATLIELEPNIGTRFVDWLYREARERTRQFGETLLDTFENGFVGAPTAPANLVRVLVANVLAWLAHRQVPEVPPVEGWGNWIVDLPSDGVAPDPTDAFREILARVDAQIHLPDRLAHYLAQLEPTARDQAQAVSGGVRIMIMAASTGLTVKATIIAAAEEGLTPSRQPGIDVREECRLLYVAMTRAKQFLFCTWARQRTGPTARAGRLRVGERNNHSSFFEAGPVSSEDGPSFINRRWPEPLR